MGKKITKHDLLVSIEFEFDDKDSKSEYNPTALPSIGGHRILLGYDDGSVSDEWVSTPIPLRDWTNLRRFVGVYGLALKELNDGERNANSSCHLTYTLDPLRQTPFEEDKFFEPVVKTFMRFYPSLIWLSNSSNYTRGLSFRTFDSDITQYKYKHNYPCVVFKGGHRQSVTGMSMPDNYGIEVRIPDSFYHYPEWGIFLIDLYANMIVKNSMFKTKTWKASMFDELLAGTLPYSRQEYTAFENGPRAVRLCLMKNVRSFFDIISTEKFTNGLDGMSKKIIWSIKQKLDSLPDNHDNLHFLEMKKYMVEPSIKNRCFLPQKTQAALIQTILQCHEDGHDNGCAPEGDPDCGCCECDMCDEYQSQRESVNGHGMLFDTFEDRRTYLTNVCCSRCAVVVSDPFVFDSMTFCSKGCAALHLLLEKCSCCDELNYVEELLRYDNKYYCSETCYKQHNLKPCVICGNLTNDVMTNQDREKNSVCKECEELYNEQLECMYILRELPQNSNEPPRWFDVMVKVRQDHRNGLTHNEISNKYDVSNFVMHRMISMTVDEIKGMVAQSIENEDWFRDLYTGKHPESKQTVLLNPIGLRYSDESLEWRNE